MTRLIDLNQQLRRQSSRNRWIPALATPSGAFGEFLERADAPRDSNRADATAVCPSTGGWEFLAALRRPVTRIIRRNRTVRALKQLDARTLADIGVERGDFEKLAAKLAARKAPIRSARLGALRRAWLRGNAIAQLGRLSDRTLNDIGIERGHIPEIVDHLLAGPGRKPAAPAARPEKLATPLPADHGRATATDKKAA